MWRTLPLVVTGGAVLGGLAWNWFFRDVQRQDKYVASVVVLFIGYAIFLVWVLIVSRWKAAARWSLFGATIAVVLFCGLTLRIKGVTGDLLPIVGWRWSTGAPASSSEPPRKAATSSEFTNSFPQFLGPDRNGILGGPSLARDWVRTPPRELWRRNVGPAWTGFAIEESRAVTEEQRGNEEVVACYDLGTGTALWAHADAERYATTIAGEGPRANPTISSNRVFAMGARGRLNCLDLATGKVLWSHATIEEFGARVPEWGVACSPLIAGNAVVVTVGGPGHAMVAYHRESGERLWSSGNDDPHWCSPVLLRLNGVPQIVVFSENVSAYDPQGGRVLWQYPWRSSYPHVTTPVQVGTNRVLVSQGYGGGSELLAISRANNRWKATRVWKSIRLKSKFAALIVSGHYVYGLDDGALVCVDLDTGELKWKGDRYGHGQMLLVGKVLLITAESGEVVLADANSTEFHEFTRFHVFNSKTWNPPAIAGEILLMRNDHEAAAIRLPLAADTPAVQAAGLDSRR